MDFKDKVIIVTGASSGIGAGTAVHFAQLGGHLTLVGRNVEKLQEVADSIKAIKGQVPLIIEADMTNEEDVKRIASDTLNKCGKIDVLVNNAGVLESGTIENTSLEQYDRVMATNIRAVYQLTMLVVPELVKTKGCIVNVSSVNGIHPFPGVLAYNVSKSAVDQFTRCVALELAPKRVRCNSVNLGVILTETQERSGMNMEGFEIFFGRHGKIDEVSSVIAFLASDKASFITGANLPIDGGRHTM